MTDPSEVAAQILIESTVGRRVDLRRAPTVCTHCRGKGYVVHYNGPSWWDLQQLRCSVCQGTRRVMER